MSARAARQGPRRVAHRVTALVFGCLALAGCGLFDFGIEWRSGPYGLTWVDLPDEVALSYDVGHGAWGTLVGPRVFAVGADDRYVVAKQHPSGDKRITNYFIVDRRRDPFKNGQSAVIGPLSEREFQESVRLLNLPSFSKVLASLE